MSRLIVVTADELLSGSHADVKGAYYGADGETPGVVVLGGNNHMPNPAQAEDLVVTSNADSGNSTLRAAVATAFLNGQDDNITFNLPDGNRTITLTSGQILLAATAETTIDGGTAGVTVSGNDQSRVFQVNADLTLTNLTVRDSRYNYLGGGIRNLGGTLSITDSTISANTAYKGGGIFNSGPPTVTDSTIGNNSIPNGFVSGGG